MQVEIHSAQFEVTEALRTHIERRLEFALGRFADRIRKVRVNLCDLNGPKGGTDKRCQLVIRLTPRETIVIGHEDSDVYAAVDIAADKARTAAGRQLKRFYSSGPPPAAGAAMDGDGVTVGKQKMQPPRKKILIADCHEEVLIALEKVLEDAGFETATAWTTKDALQLLDSEAFDLALVNEYLLDAECEELLTTLQRRAAEIPVIVMQPSAPEITDVRTLERLGARHVVCKYDYRRIVEAVSEGGLRGKRPELVA